MARSRSYDDMSDERVSSRGGSSTKILLIVILMSILICIIAVLLWVKILESQEKLNVAEEKSAPTAAESVAQAPPVQETKAEAVEQAPAEAPASTDSTPDLSIDSGISALSSTSGMETDYITSSDYAIADVPEEADVTEESVEMKKPVIAQNLSISQQSFAKDIVKYQEYKIQEGDTLISIADSFGVSVQTLVAVNQIKCNQNNACSFFCNNL